MTVLPGLTSDPDDGEVDVTLFSPVQPVSLASTTLNPASCSLPRAVFGSAPTSPPGTATRGSEVVGGAVVAGTAVVTGADVVAGTAVVTGGDVVTVCFGAVVGLVVDRSTVVVGATMAVPSSAALGGVMSWSMR